MNIRKVALAVLCLVAPPAAADPISGYVKGSGTVAIPSSLYTVVRTHRGHYTITFTNPMVPRANCVITPLRSLSVYELHESDTECRVVLHNDYSTLAVDGSFSFMAVPMSN